MSVAFASANLHVRVRRVSETKRWIVTFDHYDIGAGFDRVGFGEAFLAGERINAVHVLGAGNDWYQYDDIDVALAAVRAAIGGADRIVTYGSSMGGFAAIRFADRVGADAVIALSPQYTIDPAVVPWERRWARDSDRIAWLPAGSGPIGTRAHVTLFYDPTCPDRAHAELIARDTPCALIPIPRAGHPVGSFLNTGGHLQRIILRAIDATLEPNLLRRELRGGGEQPHIPLTARRGPARLPPAPCARARATRRRGRPGRSHCAPLSRPIADARR